MKICTKCKINKEFDKFYKSSKSKDNHCSYCKVCAKEAVDNWKLLNPEKRKRNQTNYYKKQNEILKIKRKQRINKDPETYKNLAKKHSIKARLKKYGLCIDSFNKKLEDQNNKCIICKRTFSEKIKPVIDHCHKTGKTRDILCVSCNIGLGFIEKDNFISNAITYIKKHDTYELKV